MEIVQLKGLYMVRHVITLELEPANHHFRPLPASQASLQHVPPAMFHFIFWPDP